MDISVQFVLAGIETKKLQTNYWACKTQINSAISLTIEYGGLFLTILSYLK